MSSQRPTGYAFGTEVPEWARADLRDTGRVYLLGCLSKLSDLHDHRALVIVGALVVETSLDRFLEALIPGYGELEKADITFSMKIALARGLRFFPPRSYTAASLVRKIRNVFAHDLDVRQISDLPDSLLQSIYDRLVEKGAPGATEAKKMPDTDTERFTALILGTSLAFYRHAYLTSLLVRFMHQKDFLETLRAFSEEIDASGD